MEEVILYASCFSSKLNPSVSKAASVNSNSSLSSIESTLVFPCNTQEYGYDASGLLTLFKFFPVFFKFLKLEVFPKIGKHWDLLGNVEKLIEFARTFKNNITNRFLLSC